VSSLCCTLCDYHIVQDLHSSHLALTVLTLNKFLWLKFSSFTGSPIHPPPSRCSQHPPSGGLEGGKARCIREREDMVAFQGGHPPFKGDSTYLRPQPSWAESSPTRSKVLPYGAGAGSHMSCKLAQWLQAALHFCPDKRAKGRAAMQAACNRAKWAHFSDSQHAQHGGPGPRVMQPACRMLRACNCTATRATTAPPRLRNRYRDSRRPIARPSGASLARRSMQPKMGRQ
jgi:hypothetical protein